MTRTLFIAVFFLLVLQVPGTSMSGQDKDGFYRDLAAYWSPDLWQDTWFYPEADYITAFDGDGDWTGSNNLESLRAGRFEPYRAYLYYAVMETRTHYLLIYEVFHPFDYDHPLLQPIGGTHHENDTEAIMVIVRKSSESRFGRFRGMQTHPHGYTRYYAKDPRVRLAVPKLLEKPSLRDGRHPEVYIQRGGHGPYALHAREQFFFIRHGFASDTGVVYRYKGEAGTPEGPDDRDAGYDLISVAGERGLWTRRCDRRAFDGYRQYDPPEGRPGIPAELLCEDGTIPFNLDGDTSGDSGRADAAGVPWGHLTPDPAHLVQSAWRFPENFSAEYVYNPFLGIDRRE
ncbi:MAG: hypothetical protein R6V10_14285 [bacterium]